MVYTYYDYLENYYESYYEYYYEYTYWPYYYGNYNGTYPPSPYEYNDAPNMKIITPALFSLSVLCAVLAIIIALLTAYKMYYGKRKNKVTICLTLFCVFAHLIQNSIDPISYYAWYLNYNPSTSIASYLLMIWDISWCLAKLSLYILFIYRYWLIFEATPGNTRAQRYFVFGSFTVAMAMQCTLYIVYLVVGYSETKQRIYLNVCWAFLAIDTALILILGYLLCRAVLQLVIVIQKMRKKTAKSEKSNNQLSPIPGSHPTQVSACAESIPQNATQIASAATTESQTNGYQAYESGYLDRTEIIEAQRNAGNESGFIDRTQAQITVQLTDYVEQEPNMNHRKSALSVASQSATTTNTERETQLQKKEKPMSKEDGRLNNLLHTATRIAVTMLISMVSSFIYQIIWLLAMELEHGGLRWMSWTWCIDGVINMLCVYLSWSFAHKHYRLLCNRCCKFHQCILRCIQGVVEYKSS